MPLFLMPLCVFILGVAFISQFLGQSSQKVRLRSTSIPTLYPVFDSVSEEQEAQAEVSR